MQHIKFQANNKTTILNSYKRKQICCTFGKLCTYIPSFNKIGLLVQTKFFNLTHLVFFRKFKYSNWSNILSLNQIGIIKGQFRIYVPSMVSFFFNCLYSYFHSNKVSPKSFLKHWNGHLSTGGDEDTLLIIIAVLYTYTIFNEYCYTML